MSRLGKFLQALSKVVPVKIPNGMSTSCEVLPVSPTDNRLARFGSRYVFKPNIEFVMDSIVRNENGKPSYILHDVNTGSKFKVDHDFMDRYIVSKQAST